MNMPSLQQLEDLLRLLVPVASREHVLGDLHERFRSRRQYILDAISVLGPVLFSRIRRTTDLQLIVMEMLSVYLSLLSISEWLGFKVFLFKQFGFVRLCVPTLVTIVGLLICNAYADPRKPSQFLKPIQQSMGSLAVALLGQAVLYHTWPSAAVPIEIVLWGSCFSLLLLSTLRTCFQSSPDDRQNAVILPDRRIHEGRPSNSVPIKPSARYLGLKPKPLVLIVSLLAVLLFADTRLLHEQLITPPHLLILLSALLVFHQQKS